MNKNINDVYIPPAWSNVKVFGKKSKVRVIGYDSKGREQRIYSNEWNEQQSQEKYKKIDKLAKIYPRFNKKLDEIIENERPFSKNYILAMMCRIMEKLNIRVGTDKYLFENDTCGLTTLLKTNLKNNKEFGYHFDFIGKRGIRHIKVIKDPYLINFLKKIVLMNKQNEFLFTYMYKVRIYSITSIDLNNFVKEHLGDNYSCKDIRTYSANKIFSNILKKLKYDNETQKKKNVVLAIKSTAEQLGNTPSICRKSYIDPRIIEKY